MTTQNTSHSKKRRFFARRDTAQPGPIVLKRRIIYILPSKAGLGLALVLFIMLLGSMNYNNSMGYALSFLLGSMAMVSMLHTHRTLLGLRIEAGKVLPVFAGQSATFQLWIDNRGHAARHALVWQRDIAVQKNFVPRPLMFWKPQRSFGDKTFLDDFTIDIPADQRVSIDMPVPTSQRGRVFLGRLKVYTRFPLGLFHAWSYIHLDTSTLVYPQPLGHRNLPLGQQSQNTGEGSPHDTGGDDFIGYRDYKVGDSPRHIDWKAVARGRNWMIKQFGGLRAAQVWLTWDGVSMLNNLEAALSQLCLWILVAESQGAQYGLKIPTCSFEPNSGEQHRELCLQALALYALPEEIS